VAAITGATDNVVTQRSARGTRQTIVTAGADTYNHEEAQP
jgi:hypothetical protein